MKPLRKTVLTALVGVLLLGAPVVRMSAQAESSSVRKDEASTADAQKADAQNAGAPQQESLHQQEEDEDAGYRHSATVVKLGSLLHLDPEQAATLFEWLNFAALAAGIGYLMLKMLPKAFGKRSSAIQKHLVDARTATEEASARLSAVEGRLAKLDEQIAAMRTQAEADSARDEQRIKAGVEDEKKKILEAAEAEIASATAMARRELQSYAAGLAIDHAARKLVVSAETDRLLVENFAHRLGAEKGSEN